MSRIRRGKNSFNIPESDIRSAIRNTNSSLQAAEFLRVHWVTFKKYALLYIDMDTGKTLFELSKNQAGRGIRKSSRFRKTEIEMLHEILNGEHPYSNLFVFKNNLIKHAILPEECSNCTYNERRIIDYKMPLKLDFIDGNKRNLKRKNLRLLCFNCYHNIVGNIAGPTAVKYE